MFSHLPTGRARAVEPTVLVKLGDVVDQHLLDWEPFGENPQPLGPEVVTTSVDQSGNAARCSLPIVIEPT